MLQIDKPLPGPVLLATDGSRDSHLAAAAAVHLSNRARTPLHLVHAWGGPALASADTRTVSDELLGTVERDARLLLGREVDRIRKAGDPVAEGHLREGDATDVVLAVALEIGAGLIVIGSRGRGAVRRIFFGSVAEGVLRGAHCPALVTRDRRSWPPTRVVVGDDGSDVSLHTARTAIVISMLTGAPVTLVRAQSDYELLVSARGAPAQGLEELVHEITGSLRERAVGLERETGVRMEVMGVIGEPAEALIQQGDSRGEATILAVGRRGLGRLDRLAFGSVSIKVLRGGACPVLVCPPVE